MRRSASLQVTSGAVCRNMRMPNTMSGTITARQVASLPYAGIANTWEAGRRACVRW